jgi:hypothetical protein
MHAPASPTPIPPLLEHMQMQLNELTPLMDQPHLYLQSLAGVLMAPTDGNWDAVKAADYALQAISSPDRLSELQADLSRQHPKEGAVVAEHLAQSAARVREMASQQDPQLLDHLRLFMSAMRENGKDSASLNAALAALYTGRSPAETAEPLAHGEASDVLDGVRGETTWIETNAWKQLDLDALQWRDKNTASAAQHSMLEPEKIRLRQDAVREIMTGNDSDGRPLMSSLESWKGSFDPLIWHRQTVSLSDFFTVRPSALAKVLKSDELMSGEEKLNLNALANGLQAVFQDMETLGHLLEGAAAQELKDIGWMARSAADPGHPYGLQDLHAKLKISGSDAERRATLREALSRKSVREALNQFYEIQKTVGLISAIAEHAHAMNWGLFPTVFSPQEKGGPFLSIVEGRSPRAGRNSVPNSLRLEAGKNMAVITGPNTQGKSTFLRMAAQLIALALMGSPVPAREMELTPMRLNAHMNISDSPARGDSLFMSEAASLWSVYKSALREQNTLFLIDEMLPGTVDRVRRTIEKTLIRKKLLDTGGLFVLATHNMDTTSLAAQDSRITNLHVDAFHVKPGPTTDMNAMYEGAAQALIRSGWDKDVVDEISSELIGAEPPNAANP